MPPDTPPPRSLAGLVQADWGASQPGLVTNELQEAGSSDPPAAASSGQSGVDPGHEHGDAWLVYHEFNLMLGRLHLQRVQRRAQRD